MCQFLDELHHAGTDEAVSFTGSWDENVLLSFDRGTMLFSLFLIGGFRCFAGFALRVDDCDVRNKGAVCPENNVRTLPPFLVQIARWFLDRCQGC